MRWGLVGVCLMACGRLGFNDGDAHTIGELDPTFGSGAGVVATGWTARAGLATPFLLRLR